MGDSTTILHKINLNFLFLIKFFLHAFLRIKMRFIRAFFIRL